MPNPSAAELALKQGDTAGALKLLTDQVRSKPQDAKLRVFLFQMFCVLGQWDRALNQLKVVQELDASMLPMVQTYREAIACETLRLQVFAGQKVPLLFGEPEAWTAMMIEALLRDGRGEADAARQLRQQALEQAPTTGGSVDGQRFEWLADADSRLGPTLEAVINGRYYWLPLDRLAQIDIDPPQDLRDAVWMPANFQFTNGGQVVGLIPTRYPDTDLAAGGLLALARSTEWREAATGTPGAAGDYRGLGQRLFTTDSADIALMDIRAVVLDVSDSAPDDTDGTGGSAGTASETALAAGSAEAA